MKKRNQKIVLLIGAIGILSGSIVVSAEEYSTSNAEIMIEADLEVEKMGWKQMVGIIMIMEEN